MIVFYYLLISIFTQLSPYGLTENSLRSSVSPDGASRDGGHSDEFSDIASLRGEGKQVLVDFPVISGLKPGSPVLVQGNQVGRVTKISPKSDAKNRNPRNSLFEVAIEIDSSVFGKLAKGTCALQAMPMTDGKKSNTPVLELFIPSGFSEQEKLALLRPGDRIPGFASYEEFWRSGSETRSRQKGASKAG